MWHCSEVMVNMIIYWEITVIPAGSASYLYGLARRYISCVYSTLISVTLIPKICARKCEVFHRKT